MFQVELTKGSRVWVPSHFKNSIKRDGDGDPSKMVRLGLLGLYGRDALQVEDLTAKGTRNGTKGMRPEVRSALLGQYFVLLFTIYRLYIV